jgi:putative FmdB family regulatory protein
MPTYQYRCTTCMHEFEMFQKIIDDPLKFCPACQTEALKKIITQGNFVLKGEKWFKNSGAY